MTQCRTVCRALAVVITSCSVFAACGQHSIDRFYATAAGKLLTIEVQDIDKVTVRPVGDMGAFGCASLARSTAGLVYSVCGEGIVKPGPQQLATIDPKSGHATTFGKIVEGLQVMALEFAPDGTLYSVGDANPASPSFNSFYTVDVKTGEFTRVGSTGVPAPEFFMDFAFDSRGTMYGASSHALFTIDPKTGTATKVADFVGGGDIMGLAYNTNQDKLYATDWKAPNSALYLVNIRSGFLTPVAATGYPRAHGLVPLAP